MASPTADTSGRYPPRRWWRKVPFIPTRPREDAVCVPSSEESQGGANPQLPEMGANILSIITFGWLHRILAIGYTRPLVAEELYSMPDHRQAKVYAARLEEAWARRSEQCRVKAMAEKEQGKTKSSSSSPSSMTRLGWQLLRKDAEVEEKKWKKKQKDKNNPSLLFALNDVIFSWFWIGGLLKLIGDLSIITSPLLVRAVINTLSHTEGPQAESQRRRGFGLVVGLFLLLVLSVVCNVHGFYRSYSTGIALRGALIHVIYKRATKLSEKARKNDGLGPGKLLSLVSADVSRIDFCCGYFHMGWTSIVQIVVSLALMIYSLQYSALPGFALVALLYPTQNFMVRKLFALRRLSMPFTDARVKAIVEAVASIRLVKTYAWEPALLKRIRGLRSDEMGYLRKRLILRSFNTAISFTVPTLAAVVSFVCYAGTGHSLDSGVIFSALAFFLLLRTPLQMLPVCLSAMADARAAIDRLERFMHADMRGPDPPIDEAMDDMVSIRDAHFEHHDQDDDDLPSSAVSSSDKLAVNDEKKGLASSKEAKSSTGLYIDELAVRRGDIVVIVGPVGSGKSSLLRALLGDMCAVKSEDLRLGAPVAYCPQTAWLLSATVRENIIFGKAFDEKRYEDVVRQCCLEADLATLVDGDQTVVGEKGISLSGGQKQRISLARAVYSGQDRPLRLLDDCFSALDAHVGARVFENVVLEEKKRRRSEDLNNSRPTTTTVLVSHSLALVPHADHVVYLESGSIKEQGAYADLIERGGAFAKLMQAGLKQQQHQDRSEAEADDKEETVEEKLEVVKEEEAKAETGKEGEKEGEKAANSEKAGEKKEEEKKEKKTPRDIMQKEERLVGSVTFRTYLDYIFLGHAPITVPLFVTSIVFYQAATILSPLWLSWWESNRWPFLSQGVYMGVYAALGIGQSLGLFCMSASFALFAFYTSIHLHSRAAKRILHAPLAFFDTTPQGRIVHRFSRDVDAVDNVVGETLRLFISTTVQALGSIILVAIIVPWFLAIAAVVVILYVWTGMFYRPSARELRRLNNLLRSRIYEHFSESIAGLTTLRAYGAVSEFEQENAKRIDSENRAYWLSIACQRWLNVRLDFLGAMLVFATGLLVVGLRGTITPANGGVVLSYMVTVQSVFGQMIRQSAEIENNMNSIERLLHYANKVEQEAPHENEEVDKPLEKSGWPSKGVVEFDNITASHRPELAPALRGVSLAIASGQKVGVVGRTGAGKTTCEFGESVA